MYKQITLKEFRDNGQASSIKAVRIIKEEGKGYAVVATLTWKAGEYQLYVYRNTPRYFANLDRLVRMIEENAPTVRRIELEL